MKRLVSRVRTIVHRLFSAALLALLLAAWCAPLLFPARAQGNRQALLITLDGPLTNAMVTYLERSLREAQSGGYELVIAQLDTPGGSIVLMQEMVQDILASPVPVVVYVAPQGAMAGSAGTFITLAGHAAAMAPGTIIGAASPVDMSGADLDETMLAKETNALMADARELAERRGERAVALAESTVENAVAASSQEALQAGLVDFIAADVSDLLSQLDGFPVEVQGQERTLDTADALPIAFPPTLIEQVLHMITSNPNILVLLLNLGVAAILIEIASPGGWVAGTIGVISLALAAYGLGVLPVNWVGAIFLVLAFVLFVLDLKAPTHGALTAAGIGSLILGAMVLFNPANLPGLPPISLPLVIASAVLTGGLFFVVLIIAIRAQAVPVQTGHESLLGREGTVTEPLCPRGQVRVGGEVWSADLPEGHPPLLKGERVRVVEVVGLRLLVEKAT